MTALRIFAIFSAAALQCLGVVTNDIESQILAFPAIEAWGYRPDRAAECANVVIGAGEAARAALSTALKNVATNSDLELRERINGNACLLCRLCFVPTSAGGRLRPPRLGGPAGMPYNSMSPSAWPDLPFFIMDGVPLSISLGYAGSGVAERAENYLAYCLANGKLRDRTFVIPDRSTVSNALSRVLESPAWRALKWRDAGEGWHYELDEAYVREMLWKQAANTGAPK